MSRPMRLRHKLTLGLALVVGSIALLAGGVGLAYASYQETGRSTKRKLDEIGWIIELRDAIQKISPTSQQTTDEELQHIRAGLDEVRRLKDRFRNELITFTMPRKLDANNCEEMLKRMDTLDAEFQVLSAAVENAGHGAILGTNGKNTRIIERDEVRAPYLKLCEICNELVSVMKGDVHTLFDRSDSTHRRSLAVAGFATTLAVVLILTLLYYFRVWVFAPIQQIQAGVQRVHRGEFGEPIQLRSKDELEELANEFNAMTTRLKDIYSDLAQQVDDRSRQLVRSERLVSVGFLAAGVSHEINNPLASIAFCAEALERRVAEIAGQAPQEAEVINKYLRMIQQEAFRCKEITLKLLDFSRTGGTRERTDMGQLITDVVEMARHLQNARGKSIRFAPDRSVFAPVNARDVKSVVLNLVVNALDSMDDGGTLSIGMGSTNGAAELTFTDSGCGMTKDVLDNIFEPFFTRKKTGNGTGLGLSISNQIIHQHGGTIVATSPGPGKGSTFTVRLPITAPVANDEPDRPAVLPFPSSRVAA
ncbi:MAG: HAMP domain-containing sensor histidine kinase [Gemmataceae bacterium]